MGQVRCKGWVILPGCQEVQGQAPGTGPANGICKGLEGREHRFDELTASSSASLEQEECESR